jgi:protein HIRA/HIR1
MVVAEVPLWVVHSNNANAAVAPGGGSSDQATATAMAGSDNTATTINKSGMERASESLTLLDDNNQRGSGGSGGLQKAAIYSVDVHGTKFATGGGDGTVRIWNVNALFPKPKTLIKSHYQKRKNPLGSTTMTTSAASVDPNNTTINTINTVSTMNNYESSGESSHEETGDTPNSSPEKSLSGEQQQQGETTSRNNGENENTSLSQQQDPVHDLSSVVRRKKDGSSAPTSSPDKLQRNPTTSNRKEQPLTGITNNNNNNTTDRLLCTLSAHTGSSVLAVRFSNNGKYLASAGDDAVVCIYAQQNNPNGGTGGGIIPRGNLENHGAAVEHWVRIKLCRGHGLDAVGLAWAPDDSHLVSCSLDSNTPIIVWKLTDLHDNDHTVTNYSNVICNPYKILGKGIHTSTVKGVTFDPAGTYLASSGDDPSVCIWRAHDDWGLEKRIDSKSGIFRKWNNGGDTEGGGGSKNINTLSSQSLFRRLSWSTDGAYICTTNAVVKNKNVASTISREGWAVSNDKGTASGAVNLVGHKQPVVASRHCPYLLNAKTSTKKSSSKSKSNKNDDSVSNKVSSDDNHDSDDSDSEPEYSTLLALGDKKGFVTVWSTRKSRPLFKIQCSESRCTVTDLSWGRLSSSSSSSSNNSNGEKKDQLGDLMLIVSLLDGQVVALRFGIPDEFGKLLKPTEQARVFQLRYGIDLNDTGTGHLGGRRRLFVGDNSGPKLIENALQFSFENRATNDDDADDEDENENNANIVAATQQKELLSSEEIRVRQSVSRSKGGKKRIQPLLMQTTALIPPTKKPKLGDDNNKPKTMADTLETAMELAEKAASGAAAVAAAQKSANTKTTNNEKQIAVVNNNNRHQNQQQNPQQPHIQQQQQQQQHHRVNPQNIQLLAGAAQSTPQIPHSTDRIHSVELPLLKNPGNLLHYVADCTNSIQVPKGSSGSALPCTVLSISKTGQTLWKDQLLGSSCSAIAASKSWLVVGTSDGCVQIYGTSPTIGWASGSSFRSHPPYILGRPIVALHLREQSSSSEDKEQIQTELLVVTSDGRFAVYVLEPRFKLQYKGSLLPAMTHMLLSADLETDLYLPKLARIQLTETNRLLLLLSLHSVTSSSDGTGGGRGGGTNQPTSVGAGGSLQGFIYDIESDLWMRMADSRFVLSDLYNTLPSMSSSSSKKTLAGELSKLDDSVRMGAGTSTLQRSRRQHNDDLSSNDVASRSHCEDRMSCAVALGSASEFEYWFSKYIKILSLTGNESVLRLVIDMLLGKDIVTTRNCNGESNSSAAGATTVAAASSSTTSCYCWWLSDSPKVLNCDRVKLVRTVVIPEMSKNRSLQRITNEIAIEIDSLE